MSGSSSSPRSILAITISTTTAIRIFEVQQVAHRAARPLDLMDDVLEHLALLLVRVAVEALHQGLGIEADVVEGVVQLVGDARRQGAHGRHPAGAGQLRLPVLEPGQHPVDRDGQIREPVKKPVGFRLRASGYGESLGKALPEACSLEPVAELFTRAEN